MSEMVDSATEAFIEAYAKAPVGLTFSDGVRFAMRAAIAAMREPTEDMLAEFSVSGREASRMVWRAMIDAALK